MRHQTERPSDQVMHFFTPELYLQFNSPDNEIADQADEAWEMALQEYQQHLERIRADLPPQVSKVSELNLHDAEVLQLETEVEMSPHRFSFRLFYPLRSTIINLKQDKKIWSLIYMLSSPTRSYPAMEGWYFSKLRKHWLYDELDKRSMKDDLFIHRILFSDGSVLEISFFSVFASSFTLSEEHKERMDGRSSNAA